jgi:hypothetical protein
MPQSSTSRVVLSLLAAIMLPTSVQAVGLSIGISASPGTRITDLTGFQTTGSDMAGAMSVTAFFGGGGQETIPWVASGAGAGGATGTGWTLTEIGDTFSDTGAPGLWTLDVSGPNTILDRILLNGVTPTPPTQGTQSVGVIFDRTVPEFGTGGSYRGRDFKLDTATGVYDLVVTYIDEIDNLADGVGQLRDAWGQLSLDFVPLATGGGGFFDANSALSFRQDTDLVGVRSGQPGPEEFPEPAVLSVTMAACAVALRRTRR